MCGIFGELAAAPGEAGADLASMAALMIRRGPDDVGQWEDASCRMAFRRLSILDLSEAANQPMHSASGRSVLVFNGELYNFRELRAELGGTFRTTGDTEVALEALERWGRSALDRFNGMFALAFYDQAARTLLVARDHAGIKPIYVAESDRGVVFASQLDQILSHPWCASYRWSEDGLAQYVRLGTILAPYSPFQGVSMLEPGCWREYDQAGARREGCYFRFRAAANRAEVSLADLDATLEAAVLRQKVSDVPVGAFLSGGIDSPLVSAYAKEKGIQLDCFTTGSDDPALDETETAGRYAAQLGLDHSIEHLSATQGLELIPDVIEACTEPQGDYSIFPTMAVSRLARTRVGVALTGDGGDELFWGYASRMSRPVTYAPLFALPAWVRRGLWLGARVALSEHTWAPFNLPSIGAWYLGSHQQFYDEWLADVFEDVPRWPEGFAAFECTAHRRGTVADWVRENEYRYHMPRVLLKVDRASMHHSLEARVPLLDKDVVSFAQRLTYESCCDRRRQVGKIPLRRLLERKVGFETPGKTGFSVPMRDWLCGPLRPFVEEFLLDARELCGLPLRAGGLRKHYQVLLDGQDIAWGIWNFLALALWEERHVRGRSVPLPGS